MAIEVQKRLHHSIAYCLRHVILPQGLALAVPEGTERHCRCNRTWRAVNGVWKLVVFSAGMGDEA